MKKTEVKLLAVIGASAAVTLGVLGVAAGQAQAGAGSVGQFGDVDRCHRHRNQPAD